LQTVSTFAAFLSFSLWYVATDTAQPVASSSNIDISITASTSAGSFSMFFISNIANQLSFYYTDVVGDVV